MHGGLARVIRNVVEIAGRIGIFVIRTVGGMI